MLTHVYFVRHAHSVYTAEESTRPLSPAGLADAERVKDILSKENVDIIISSPYKRAIQTVEGIAKIQQKEVILDEGFRERCLADGPVGDFNFAIAKVWENPSFSWEGGESNRTAQNRGIQAFRKVLREHEGERIVIGTHGNIMVLIMNYFDEKFGFDFWKELAMPDIYKLSFDGEKLEGVHRIWK